MTIERERQLETFQFRIQEETNLMDDEIVRLNNHLQFIEAEIIDAQDKYNNLSVKYDQRDQFQKGKEARTIVSRNALLNEIKSDYYGQMAKLGEEQTKQIQTIHNEFEEFFSQVEPWMNTKIEKEITPIEQKISAIKEKIERVKNTVVQSQDVDIKSAYAELTASQEFDDEQLRRLEATLKEKTKERLENLSRCQEQLQDCINVLEEKENAYQLKVKELTSKLDLMETHHKDKIKKETDKQERELTQMRQKLQETLKRAADVKKASDASSNNMKTQLNAILIDNQSLLSSVPKSIAVETQAQTNTELQDETRKLEQLFQKREQDENRLAEARTRNESLKRELARLRHELRVRRHREAYN
ncbi:hypothetical protein TVAG_065170 [Trichomonas vaginalis G3]|uniref:Uncharacterized protein n=1 Tax=Trichomonas vaginalis (strain ATCC PRA-98 / G3) TaxID=412133 RepID=A2FUV0_TRIV3|nr:hypothetical protein TVAGG3_1033150 [Trichomonas vaginalis G3]EAX91301.1 hypothetical protein TVAG_065170 [Trichomonas vaginalis G3]KAI5493016.1 hypothetical protein TVAGG3_1033150 [Trichomonas vaginalis G3]|eukprot:XP_001304231.1 hypothetical protein [Trichomonas vaginalis G3]